MLSSFRIGIRGQILTIALIPALIVIVILVFVIYRGNIVEGDRALERHGNLLAAQLAANLEYPLTTGAVDQLPSTVAASVEPATEALGTREGRVLVLDRDGQTLFDSRMTEGSAPAESDHPLVWMVSLNTIKTFMASIYLNPLDTGRFQETLRERRYLGKVIIKVPTAPIKLRQLEKLLWDLGLVAITFCGALVLAFRIGRRLSVAVKQTAEAILRIKAGDLSVRLEKTEASEIGTLQEGVNLAVEAIVKGKDELEQALSEVRAKHELALSELRVQTDEAERANQTKSMFLAKVSHEMRTPLYSIQGLTEQLLKAPRNREDANDLGNILKASETLYHTISDILDFTQLEGGKYHPVLKPFDLWEELETNIETVSLLAQEQGLYLDVIVAPDLPQTVVGDQRGFRTSVTNLVSNAVKFTQQGGLCIRLNLDSQPSGEVTLIRLQVQDTGRGIPEDRLTTIFEPFEQIDGGLNRRYEGCGLGLSIVKSLCDAMGGSLTVESEPGKGSTFTLRWPLKVHPTAEGRGYDVELSRLKALVVDERASFCESIRSRLSSLGVEVVTRSSSLRERLSRVPPSRSFDLIVVQNLSIADSPTEMARRLNGWAKQVVSFETRSNSELSHRLRINGRVQVLWSGATRNTIAEVLRTIEEKDAGVTTHVGLLDSTEISEKHGDLEGNRVLVVEDFAMNREIMSGQLRNHGAQVIEAGDGDEAIILARQGNIDLILMDIQMPGRDGISAIREIRQNAAGHDIPIVGFTASADKLTHERVLAAGADRVLTKPISEAKLISAVRQPLAGRVH